LTLKRLWFNTEHCEGSNASIHPVFPKWEPVLTGIGRLGFDSSVGGPSLFRREQLSVCKCNKVSAAFIVITSTMSWSMCAWLPYGGIMLMMIHCKQMYTAVAGDAPPHTPPGAVGACRLMMS